MAARARLGSVLGGPALGAALVVGGVVAAALGALALDLIDHSGGGPSAEAILDVARGAAASVALFVVAGLAPARLLAPPELRPWTPLLALPLGAVVSGLALTLLGWLPLELSLALVLIAGAAGALVTGPLRRSPSPARGSAAQRLRVLLPAALVATAVASVLAAPLLRADSLVTILGGNGDAHLATGAALLLQAGPPGATRPELPIDHMPGVWSSKYPIIYVLAATSELSGLDPVQQFTLVSAVVAAGAALGFFLFALVVLGASRLGALLAMVLALLGQGAVSLVVVPYYNLLWGLATLPLVLLAAWLHVRRREGRTLALLALVATVSVLAYPLLFPFLVLFGGVAALGERRRLRARGERARWLPRPPLPRRLWIRGALAVPALFFGLVAALLLAAALQKMVAAAGALLPGGDLSEWYTPGDPYEPLYVQLGLLEPFALASFAVLGLAVVGVRRAPAEARPALAALGGGLFLVILLLPLRDGTQLFYARAMAFFGPLALALAGAGAAALLARPLRLRPESVIAALTVVLVLLSSAQYVRFVSPFVTEELWEVRGWSRELPPDTSVRVDVKPVGAQQWAGYMLSPHPLSAADPLRRFFPHPPVGRRADLLLVNRGGRPRDALGPPLRANRQLALYRMRPGVPGPDRSSRVLVDPLARGSGE